MLMRIQLLQASLENASSGIVTLAKAWNI